MAEPGADLLVVRCGCGNQMQVSRQFAGRTVTCYACGRTLAISAAALASSHRPPGPALPAVPAVPSRPAAPAAPAQPLAPVHHPAPMQQPVVYVVQAPAGQPVMAATHPGGPMVRHGSPVPSDERTIWEGRPALAYHLPGMIWCGLWILLWFVLALAGPTLFQWVQERAGAVAPEARDIITNPRINPLYASVFFLLLMAWAIWRMIRRVLIYLNAYYCFTTQRIRLRQGMFNRAMTQMELYRLKDFAVVESLWGRLFNYAHVRIVSSDRVISDVVLMGVPGGVTTIDHIREAAQWSRSETGVTTIRE